MVGERFRVRLPDRDRMGHQFAHRRLEVVVTDRTAGDPRGARGDAGLVEHDHVLARAAPPGPQFSCQVPGSAQAMNPGPDNNVRRCRGQLHLLEQSHYLAVLIYVYALLIAALPCPWPSWGRASFASTAPCPPPG